MFCIKCGGKIAEESAFCPYCGSSIDWKKPSAEDFVWPSEDPSPQPRTKANIEEGQCLVCGTPLSDMDASCPCCAFPVISLLHGTQEEMDMLLAQAAIYRKSYCLRLWEGDRDNVLLIWQLGGALLGENRIREASGMRSRGGAPNLSELRLLSRTLKARAAEAEKADKNLMEELSGILEEKTKPPKPEPPTPPPQDPPRRSTPQPQNPPRPPMFRRPEEFAPVSSHGLPPMKLDMRVPSWDNLSCPRCGYKTHIQILGEAGRYAKRVPQSLIPRAALAPVGRGMGNKSFPSKEMEFLCPQCKNKFRSLPFIAQPENILSSPFSLTIATETNTGMVRFYINGICYGGQNERFLTVPLQSRLNTVVAVDMNGKAYEGAYRFEAVPGGSLTLRCRRRLPPFANEVFFIPENAQ